MATVHTPTLEIVDHENDSIKFHKLTSGSVVVSDQNGKDLVILNVEDRAALVEFLS